MGGTSIATRGIISSNSVTNVGTMGEIDIEILYDEYNITVLCDEYNITILYD